jgi:glutamyl-tRNA synthetase
MTMLRARFAPSPTGDLHLGGAWTALAAWAVARASRGTTVMRLEDIDTPRVVAGSAARIADDLAWLGLDWDESPAASGPHAPYTQSERTSVYETALERLAAAGLSYACDCSRAEIARVASAPHPGEETVYPGTCRDAPPDRRFKRPPAIRLRVPEASHVAFDDAVVGHTEQHVGRTVSDFVLRRGDGVFAYQLVVAIDDAEMAVTHVVRADDLLASTARQILLMRLLGYAGARVPTYAHVPLVVAPDGERLSKRTRGATVRALRERGVSAEEITGVLAHGLGLVSADERAMTPREVASSLEPPARWRKTPWRMPRRWSE